MSKKYLTAPFGYVITGDPVEMDDLEGLKSVAHNMVASDNEEYHNAVDKMNLKEIQGFFL